MDVNVENFLSDKISIEISFAKENLIDYRTENGYCFGFYEGSVKSLRRIIVLKTFLNELDFLCNNRRSHEVKRSQTL